MTIALENLVEIRQQNMNKSIVLTSGTFDLLHIGHVRYLEAVKSYGDIVVVMLSSDARVKARKGPQRPIIPEVDRAQMLRALKVVDYVFIDPATPTHKDVNPVYGDIVASLQPDLYVTDGEDSRFSKLLDAKDYILVPRVPGGSNTSTTDIINRIKSLQV